MLRVGGEDLGRVADARADRRASLSAGQTAGIVRLNILADPP